MTTISGQPAKGASPLSGAEVLVADQSLGGSTERFTTADVAALAELYAAANGAAPERIDAVGAHFTVQASGDPKTTWFPPTIVNESGFGTVAQQTGGLQLFSRWPVSRGSTKVLEVVAEVEQVSVGSGESPVARVGLHSLMSDFTTDSGTVEVYGAATAVLTAGQIITIRQRFAATANSNNNALAWADDANAAWFRPFVQVNLKSDLTGNLSTSVARVRRLVVRDVGIQFAGPTDIRSGDGTKAASGSSLLQSAARVALTRATTIAWNVLTDGYAATVAPQGGDTIGAPAGGYDGQPISLEVVNTAGGALSINWNTGAGGWDFGLNGLPTIPTTAGKALKVYADFNVRTNRWEAGTWKASA